ncbi:MAG TPA: hypothetical protein VFD91_12175 [Mariniphaga sp.]|nr:hypothetical protein [Mariniphaga sp.]
METGFKNTSENGSALLSILLIGFILNIVLGIFYLNSKTTLTKSGDRRLKVSSLNIAESGKEKLYAMINAGIFRPESNRKETVIDNENFGGGYVTVICSTGLSEDTLYIHSMGKHGDEITEIQVVSVLEPNMPFNGIPAALKGAITSRNTVQLTGNITVDGRDHDPFGNVIGSGTYGVYTCMYLNMGSNAAKVGGNDNLPACKPVYDSVKSLVVFENAAITPQFNSPESFLGLPSGALDKYKVSSLTVPFKGIQYVTKSVGPVHFGSSSGILIVHNDAGDAKLKINQGTFKGLIICDQMDKINGVAEIIGGIAALGKNSESIFGNGNADILYSTGVLLNLGDYCENVRKKIVEIVWQEI